MLVIEITKIKLTGGHIEFMVIYIRTLNPIWPPVNSN